MVNTVNVEDLTKPLSTLFTPLEVESCEMHTYVSKVDAYNYAHKCIPHGMNLQKIEAIGHTTYYLFGNNDCKCYCCLIDK